jgi:hypothetical protein
MRISDALLLVVALPTAACGPWGPKGIAPGGALLGKPRESPGDWSFAGANGAEMWICRLDDPPQHPGIRGPRR